MPRSDASDLVRVEVLLPPEIVAAAREQLGDSSLSRFMVELLAKRLHVPYTPPKRGRPVKRQG